MVVLKPPFLPPLSGRGGERGPKKGYASLEIVMELRDKHCLYQIKQKFGGSVKLRAGDNHLRYRLHHKAAGLLNPIKAVTGLDLKSSDECFS